MKRVHAHVFGEYRTTLVHELQEESRERYSYTDRGVSACISACPPLTISIFIVPCEYMVNNDLHEDACRFCGCPSWRVNTSPTIPTREPSKTESHRSFIFMVGEPEAAALSGSPKSSVWVLVVLCVASSDRKEVGVRLRARCLLARCPSV